MRTLRILEGNWLTVARALKDNSVHMAVCSPPYWGLRDYKTEPQIWDSVDECAHTWQMETVEREMRRGVNLAQSVHSTRGGGKKIANVPRQVVTTGFCALCGAWRGELGQEPTPDLYIQHLVQVFREVMRVLRPDGTLWIDIADSYATGAGSARSPGGVFGKSQEVIYAESYQQSQVNRMPIAGLKTGDLVGIPWSLALALRADGWYLRRDNIWNKTSCMPESVTGWRWEQHRIKVKPSERAAPGTKHAEAHRNAQGARNGKDFKDHSDEYEDCPGCKKCNPNEGLILRKGSGRCTTAHEYIFHLSKSENYFYDSDAIAEEQSEQERARRLRELASGHKTIRTASIPKVTRAPFAQPKAVRRWQ